MRSHKDQNRGSFVQTRRDGPEPVLGECIDSPSIKPYSKASGLQAFRKFCDLLPIRGGVADKGVEFRSHRFNPL